METAGLYNGQYYILFCHTVMNILMNGLSYRKNSYLLCGCSCFDKK